MELPAYLLGETEEFKKTISRHTTDRQSIAQHKLAALRFVGQLVGIPAYWNMSSRQLVEAIKEL